VATKATAKTVKLSDLVPDSRNANKGTLRGLAMLDDSLREDGAGRGILLDRNNNIIAGNKTIERAVDAGFEEIIIVPTDGKQLVATQRVDVDLDSPQGRRMGLRDNRVGQVDLEFDPDVLKGLQGEGLDLSTLWDADELAELLASVDGGTPATDPGAQTDRAEELQAKWQVLVGETWRIPSKTAKGEHRLVCGDCTDRAVVERVMRGERAALVVTDPPYGVEYADKNQFLNAIFPGNRIEEPIAGDHQSKADTQEMWKSAFKQMADVMKPGAVVYCFMPQGGDQMMMMMMMMMRAGIEPRHELIWLKNNHVLGRTDYAYKHEPILYAWKEGGHKFYGDFQTSVIECDKPMKSDLHPTTKPTELIERLIDNSSARGEVVYDPFAGSGTTGVACEQTNRLARLVEIAPNYCAVILERLAGLGLTPERAQ
jgi:DNA modification methylase